MALLLEYIDRFMQPGQRLQMTCISNAAGRDDSFGHVNNIEPTDEYGSRSKFDGI